MTGRRREALQPYRNRQGIFPSLDGIHYLRALGNADALRRDLAERERVVLIGGSYIACETAASLTELGKRCTLVMLESRTLERSFGAQAGGYFQSVLEDHGIEVLGEDGRNPVPVKLLRKLRLLDRHTTALPC